ncbi:uncharacterized protein [Palaemon carinicauda]|uniref:uncharacterized protein isoform X2 n=1 Tax=Palaemon carinicauda TaxID=392227 RepID=UPI0035B5FC93
MRLTVVLAIVWKWLLKDGAGVHSYTIERRVFMESGPYRLTGFWRIKHFDEFLKLHTNEVNCVFGYHLGVVTEKWSWCTLIYDRMKDYLWDLDPMAFHGGQEDVLMVLISHPTYRYKCAFSRILNNCMLTRLTVCCNHFERSYSKVELMNVPICIMKKDFLLNRPCSFAVCFAV